MHMDGDKQWDFLKTELMKCHLHVSSLKDEPVFLQSLRANSSQEERQHQLPNHVWKGSRDEIFSPSSPSSLPLLSSVMSFY